MASKTWYSKLKGKEIATLLSFYILLLLISTLFVMTQWTARWDQLFYDSSFKFLQQSAPDDIVIIAIDEQSIDRIGRWPWPRGVHAQLLNKLTEAGVKAVAMDVLFVETNHQDAQGDAAFVKAVKEHGHVVLPVAIEQVRAEGVIIELLPFGELASVAKLGHVHVSMDQDGVARRVFLKEGMGHAFWPHFALTLLEETHPQEYASLKRLIPVQNEIISPHVIVRDAPHLIPFYGPPGHFQSISYDQILYGETPLSLLKDKVVFIGVTAVGLGDSLPTPVSGIDERQMSGVEVNANIYAGLRERKVIVELNRGNVLATTMIFVTLAAVLLPLLTPRAGLFAIFSLLIVVVLSSYLLLSIFSVWFAPASALVVLVLAYPLWAWRRLEYLLSYVDEELKEYSTAPSFVFEGDALQQQTHFNFLKEMMPVKGLALCRDKINPVLMLGEGIDCSCIADKTQRWVSFYVDDQLYHFGIVFTGERELSEDELKYLEEYVRLAARQKVRVHKGSFEHIRSRVEAVKQASERYMFARQFMQDSIEQMRDGVVITDPYGHIMMSNAQASLMTGQDERNPRCNTHIIELLMRFGRVENKKWHDIVTDVLLHRKAQYVQIRNRTGSTLLVQLSPLFRTDQSLEAMIVSMTDISPLVASEAKRKEYLNFLSHDLRSPLTSAMALVDLSLGKRERTMPSDELEVLKGHFNRALSLAEQFVQLSRAEYIAEADFVETNLCDVLDNAVNQMWEIANQKHIVLDLVLDRYDLFLNGNTELLERVFSNLLDNAIKFSPPNSIVKVTAVYNILEEQICCHVIDKGLGIPSTRVEKLFDRYYRDQSSSTKSVYGVGLGLAFVRTVIDKHKGEINVLSAEGAGTDISICLPALK